MLRVFESVSNTAEIIWKGYHQRNARRRSFKIYLKLTKLMTSS